MLFLEFLRSEFHTSNDDLFANKTITVGLFKNAQMQGIRSAFHLPIRQAIARSEAYFNVRRNDER
ncbi:MAG: hypothetical protein A2162_11730 [Deltaproteobacteria bacterium RBG_13_52_11b]|nr:MAG: hypothetical protein A2162_11730 [Deltaproteobacteria bacterium RBG_13_52_11b]